VPHAIGGEEARPVNIMRAIETMATASGGINNGVSRTLAPTDSGSPANKSSLGFLTKLLGKSTWYVLSQKTSRENESSFARLRELRFIIAGRFIPERILVLHSYPSAKLHL
jgi:hypothetical protein